MASKGGHWSKRPDGSREFIKSAHRLTTARERREEERDAARRDIPEHLHSDFNRWAKGYKPQPRMTMAEAYLHHYHENKEEIEAHSYSKAEQAAKRQFREHQVVEMRAFKAAKAARLKTEKERREKDRTTLKQLRQHSREFKQASGADDYVPF